MKQKIVFYTTAVLIIQSASMHAPAPAGKAPVKGNSHFESRETEISSHRNRATEITAQQKGTAPLAARATQSSGIPVYAQEGTLQSKGISVPMTENKTNRTVDLNLLSEQTAKGTAPLPLSQIGKKNALTIDDMIASQKKSESSQTSQTPPQIPSYSPGVQARSFLQAAKNMTANKFRSEDLYTQSGKDIFGNDVTQIETRDPKTKTVISTKTIQKDGRYQIENSKKAVIEELHRDGTLEKNISFDQIGNKISDIYGDGVIGKSKIGTKVYEGQGPNYEIKDNSNLQRVIEESIVDTAGNSKTIKFDTQGKITSTQIETPAGNKTVYDRKGNTEITVPSGEKISIKADGTITMEQKSNTVTIPTIKSSLFSIKPTIEITTDPAGKTTVTIRDIKTNQNKIIEIGEDSSAKFLILETNLAKPNESPMIRSFQEDGTIYSSQKTTSGLLEKFNDGPNVLTTYDTNGKQLASKIFTQTNKEGNPLQPITVTQKNFVLTITDATMLGNPRTRVLDFSNYVEKLSSIGKGRSLRTAKTQQEQLDIINEMTEQLTGNKDILITPEYLEFRDQLREQLDAPAAQTNENRNFFMRWINNLKIRVLSKHYDQLMGTKAKIDNLRNENNELNLTANQESFISPTQDSSVLASAENTGTIAMKDGNFIVTSVDGTQVAINGKTGSISRSRISNTKLTAGDGKQIESVNGQGKKVITTMQADGKTPASQMVYTAEGIDFYPADRNGSLPQKPTAQLTKSGTLVQVKVGKTVLEMNDGIITSKTGTKKATPYNAKLADTTTPINTKATYLQEANAEIMKNGTYASPPVESKIIEAIPVNLPTVQGYGLLNI